ncbi:hypothetical protein P4908_09795 [Pantoea ananatis]|uniref:hypothetical protein n=1 Tax=Pantoea ananas TaxID=553 RepID=UPI0023F8544E|nr:hypothetical protein [Pantoea ananatis]MDF7790526.1 hypothetical protein [Pantoea ananatis]
MILRNDKRDEYLILAPKQAELYQFMKQHTEKSRSLENALGYFEFTVRDYLETHNATQAYLYEVIRKLKAFGAIQVIPRGSLPSYAKANQGFTSIEVSEC